jgi:hypothetical protein
MVGRLYTIEDEIDVIHEDLGRARRYLDSLRSDQDEIRRAAQRVQALELELREACAQMVAASERGA